MKLSTIIYFMLGIIFILPTLFNVADSTLFGQSLNKNSKYSFVNKFTVKSFYNDNIYKLSENDLNSFTDNTNLDRFDGNIESSDDLITSINGTVGIKHKYLFNHTQIVKGFFNYDYFLNNNGKKSNFNVGLSVKQYINKQNDLFISYTFHPNILTNFFKSVYEDNGIYRDYDYSKNNYFLKYNLKDMFNTGISFFYKLDYSQLYFNEFFTEYDAENLENTIGMKYSFLKNLVVVSLDYGYKISTADGIDEELANTLPGDNFGITKNLSYRSNKYGLYGNIKIPISVLFNFKSRKNLKYRIAIKYEQRYFDSDIIEDVYHVNREDFVLTINNRISYDLTKRIDLSVFHRFEKRDTKSELYSSIEDSKSYNYNMIGIGVVYNY